MPRVGTEKGTEVWRERIEGGYRRISVMQLCMSWSLYIRGRISRRDLRVWFACHELEERRCMVERGGKVSFTAEEIGVVTGGLSPRDVRASLRSLESVQLVQARKSRMRFAKTPSDLRNEDAAAATEMVSRIVNRRRIIRVPRRLVRELAAGMSKAVMATVYAHLIRCVYFRAAKSRYRTDGRCKASWIAKTFSVSERAVVTARRKLVERGWLTVLESSQWQLNRYGLRLSVELDWSSVPLKVRPQSSCPPPETAGLTSCPRANSTLLRKNRNLASRGKGIGVRERTKRAGTWWPGRLDVRDLVEPERLERLCRRLAAKGTIGEGLAEKQRVAAAAARAIRKANRNPCGLFCTIIRDELWHHIAERDDRRGIKMLNSQAKGGSDEPLIHRTRGGGGPLRSEPLIQALVGKKISFREDRGLRLLGVGR